MGCYGCAWGRRDMHSNWRFLFNSFISELEAGRGSMGMDVADGVKPGGAASSSSVCDAKQWGEA